MNNSKLITIKKLSITVLILLIISCQREKRHTIKKYYSNGRLEMEYGQVNDSILDGPFKYYYENGKLNTEGYDKLGKQNGYFKHFYEDGKISEIDLYSNGSLIKTTSFKENGEIDRDFGRTIIKSDSDSIKAGNNYKATFNLYNQEHLKDMYIRVNLTSGEQFRKDSIGAESFYLLGHPEVFHPNYVYESKREKPGEFYIVGSITYLDSLNIQQRSIFQHRFVVY